MCKGGETEKSQEKRRKSECLTTFPPLFKHFSRFHHLYTLSLYVVRVTRDMTGEFGHIERTDQISVDSTAKIIYRELHGSSENLGIYYAPEYNNIT